MAEFKGVFPAIVTPMTPEGELDEGVFRKVMEFNIRAGVDGFWIAGGGGESVLLSDEENKRIAEIAVDQGGGRAKNIMHVGAATTARAAKLAEHAAKVGADAICSVPPFFYSVGDEALVEYYRVVAAAADIPLFVYNLPQCTGVEITPDLLQKIQDRVPQLAGLKHSALDFTNTISFAQMGLTSFTGSGRLMLPALTIGAAGCIDGSLCAAPEVWVEVWNAYNAGDLERAEKAQHKANQVMAYMFKIRKYPANVKALLSERLGIECGDPRPPLPALTADERAQIRDGAERLGLLPVPAG